MVYKTKKETVTTIKTYKWVKAYWKNRKQSQRGVVLEESVKWGPSGLGARTTTVPNIHEC